MISFTWILKHLLIQYEGTTEATKLWRLIFFSSSLKCPYKMRQVKILWKRILTNRQRKTLFTIIFKFLEGQTFAIMLGARN